MMLGVGVLPIMVAMIGNMEGLAATERQGFCGSCHTMDMWIEDANNPESESLAAIHTRSHKFGGSSCYYCHKDIHNGRGGDMELAKKYKTKDLLIPKKP
jgi:cytochrome c-type protein NapC